MNETTEPIEEAKERVPIRVRQEKFIATVRKMRIPKKGDPRRPRAVRAMIDLCKDEVKSLKADGYMITTIATTLSLYRAEVRQVIDGDAEVFILRHLNLKEEEWLALRQAYERRVTEELRARRPLEIRQVQRMVETAKENLTAKSYLRQTAALLLLTGRRTFEVLNSGSLAPVDGKPMEALFSGQAKNPDRVPYEIPLLASSKDVISALAELRAKKDFSALDAMAINKKIAKELGIVVETMYGADLNKVKFTPKDLRAVYGKYCLQKLAPPEMGQTVYLASILGHVSHNELERSVADSYNDFYFRRIEEREGEAHYVGTDNSLVSNIDDETNSGSIKA